jgi:cell division septation protein DedD
VLSSRAQRPEVSGQQYAVVLVNEDQLDQLMKRPAMRQVNSRFLAQDAYSRYEKLKRRTTAAAILLLLVVAGGLAWVFVPQPAMASMFDWSKPAAIPTLYTGASFSVTVASVDSADDANVAASRLRSIGLPSFTRRSPGKNQVYQAMVGPFASLDEAEKAQRNLGTLGYRAARIFVDESLRTTPRGEQPLVDTSAANPGVLLLGAPDRLSLVLEMQSEPRQVNSSRPDGLTLQIDAGPMVAPAQPQQWSAPEGVHLLHTVSIETLSAQGGLNYLRAKVALPEFAKGNVRTEGRRIYVDLTWPRDGEDARAPRRMTVIQEGERGTAPAQSASASTSATANTSTAQGEEERYREAIEPIHQRIKEVRPFYLSATQSGSPDVYAAIDQTFAALEASINSIKVPASEAGQHQLLLAATRSAREGLNPLFPGDRVAHAQKTLVMFEGAMAAPVIVAAP